MTEMEVVEAILLLLSGLGAFLVGFKILSENIEKLANSGLKKIFNVISKNRFIGVGIGALVTALIQSSGAVTVMIVGFVNAGVIDLFQATAMIMGANIGTTITAQIVALDSLNIGVYMSCLVFIGSFAKMFIKKNEKAKTIFSALTGLGLVFLSLYLMKSSMSDVAKQPAFINVLESLENPFLLLIIGIVFTICLQSSAAVTTIIITMVSTGLVVGGGGNAILYVILGTNIGSCFTALISSIGAQTNAKRASAIHLMFNVVASAIFFFVFLLWPKFMDQTFGIWFKNKPSTQVAMFHTFFNVISTILFLPFINLFVKVSKLVVKDKKEECEVSYLDQRFLNTPAVAASLATKEVFKFGAIAMDSLNKSILCFINKDADPIQEIRDNIAKLEVMNQNILNYLVLVSGQVLTDSEEASISMLHKVLNDFYREAEIADNMCKYTISQIENSLVFSDGVYKQIELLRVKLYSQFEVINKILVEQDYTLIKLINDTEESIDNLRQQMIKEHIERLEVGLCKAASSGVFINLVSNLERAGDHLNYVAHALVNDNI